MSFYGVRLLACLHYRAAYRGHHSPNGKYPILILSNNISEYAYVVQISVTLTVALIFQTSLFIPNDSSQNLKIRKKVQMMKFLKLSFTLKNIYLEHKRNVVDVEILDDLISCHKVFSLEGKIHIEKNHGTTDMYSIYSETY